MTDVILPDWAKKKKPDAAADVFLPQWAQPEEVIEPVETEVAEQFEGGLQDRLRAAWHTTWDAASDWDKFASDKPLVPSSTTAKKFGQRIAMETAPPIAAFGETYRRLRPAGPGVALTGAALTSAGSGLAGLYTDVLGLGNVLGDDDLSPYNQLLTAAGAATGGSIPRGVNEILEAAAKRNIKLTPGAASGSKLVRWTEQAIKDMPFTGGNVNRAVQKGYEDFAQEVARLSDEGTLVPGAAIGDTLKKTAEKLNIKFGERSKQLYDVLNKAIDPAQSVKARELHDFALTKERVGAGEKFMDELVRDTLALFRESTQGVPEGRINWQSLDDIRIRAGNRIDSFGTDADKGIAKKIYALTKAEQDKIVAHLGAAEKKAWGNATRYAARHSTWKKEALAFATNSRAETIWSSLTTNPNATNIEKIIRAAGGRGSEAWKQMQATVIREMGTPTARITEDAVESVALGAFDIGKWLTNYNKISKDSTASRLFFGDLEKDMKQLAVVARGMLSPTAYKNTSKSATMALLFSGLSAPVALATGQTELAMGLASPHIAAFIGDVLLAQPWAIKHLAKGAYIPMSNFKRRYAWVKQLAAMAAAEGYKSEGEAIVDFIADPPGGDLPSVPTQ